MLTRILAATITGIALLTLAGTPAQAAPITCANLQANLVAAQANQARIQAAYAAAPMNRKVILLQSLASARAQVASIQHRLDLSC